MDWNFKFDDEMGETDCFMVSSTALPPIFNTALFS